MIERLELISYPTEANGAPVDPREIYDFSRSELDLSLASNYDIHHMMWEKGMYKQRLYFCVRALAKYQIEMPYDVHHDMLHGDFEVPSKMTPDQAYHILEAAHDAGELLRIKASKKMGGVTLRTVTQEDLDKCKANRDSLMRRWA